MATNWGFAGTMDQFCAKAKGEGYDGIEVWWPTEAPDQDELFSALEKHQLEVGFLAGASSSDFRSHLDAFRTMIDAAAHNKRKRPLYINCHSGRDYFEPDQGKAFIDHTIALSAATGIRISHETHRSRLLYATTAARQYLQMAPGLRITLDISHWCNVHESFLDDQAATINAVLQRVDHIHARVGHPEGPQVSDPRAPEWAHAVEKHFGWWDQVVQFKKQKGERLTVLTEFGPPDYMPTVPYTRQPLADQWGINVYMMQQLRNRYR